MNINFNNFLKKKIDPTRNFILGIESFYEEKMNTKKKYIRQLLREIETGEYLQRQKIENRYYQNLLRKSNKIKQKINKNKNKHQIDNETYNRLFENYNTVLNNINQRDEEINEKTKEIFGRLTQELDSPYLFDSYGLTLDQEKRFYVIKSIKKLHNFIMQLQKNIQNPMNESTKKHIRFLYRKSAEKEYGGPLPTPAETETNAIKFSNVKKLYLDPMRNLSYPVFLNLKKKHLYNDDIPYTTIELFPLKNTPQIVLQNIQQGLERISDPSILKSRLGLDKLKFSEGRIRADGTTLSIINKYLFFWVNELLYPIQIDIRDTNQRDLYLAYNEFVLQNIQFYLLYIEDKSHLKIKPNEEYIAGSWGAPFRIGTDVYKIEHLRHINISTGAKVKRKLYEKANYQMSIIFLGYMIQHYCHSFFPRYIPKPYNISFDMILDTGETHMNVASKYNDIRYYNSCDLGKFLLKKCIYKREDFTHLFFRILKQIAKILMEMQEKIGFIPHDFHTGNIIINYNYSISNTSETNEPQNHLSIHFEIKIIDVTLSSITLYNLDNKISLLKYTNWRKYRNPNILNPLVSNYYKNYDILFLIVGIVLALFIIDFETYRYINIIEFSNIQQKIALIYNFNTNYVDLFKNKYNTNINWGNCRNIIQDKNIFLEILGSHVRTDFFTPSNIYDYLEQNSI